MNCKAPPVLGQQRLAPFCFRMIARLDQNGFRSSAIQATYRHGAVTGRQAGNDILMRSRLEPSGELTQRDFAAL
jgi:hypothetical protein